MSITISQTKRVLWYIIKYKIRQETIRYGKEKAVQKRKYLQDAENHLKIGKLKYENIYDYITRGTILRSRVKWYEEGEKNNKYFLNLENHNRKKSCVRRIYNKENKLTSNPKEIINEQQGFYENLYHESSNTFLQETEQVSSKVKVSQS